MANRLIFLIIINIVLLLLVYFYRKRKVIGGLMLMAFTTTLLLSCIEFIYRFRLKNDSYYAGDLMKGFFIEDSLLGYKMKVGKYNAIKKVRDDTTFNKTYTILPDTSPTPHYFNHRVAYDTTPSKIVFLGCSFTFGEGLEDTATLPYLTGKLMHKQTINNGCNGYGIHHVYQLYQSKYASKKNANTIFVYSFLYDHLLRANGVYYWNMGGPFFKVDGDSLVYAGSLLKNTTEGPDYAHYLSLFSTFTFIKDILNNIATKNHVRSLQESDYDRCFLMIQKMAAGIQKSGGRLVLLDWDKGNWANDPIDNLPYDMLEKRLDKLGDQNIQVVRISSILDLNDKSYFIPKDGHPSEKANRKIAAALKSYLQ